MRRRPSIHALVWYQIRVGTAVMAVLSLIIVRVVLSSYGASGGAQGMVSLDALVKNPAITALYGRALSLGSPGAFVQWKTGMFLALAVAIWAALMATRVTRGAEDDQSWDLVATGRPGRGVALATTMVVVAEAGIVVGLVGALSIYSSAQSFEDCALFGVGLTGVAWCGSALGVVASQLVAPRRSATQAAVSVVGATFLLRMLADGSTSGGFLRWLSPFGWLENLGAFQHRSPIWSLALVLVPLALAVMAWRMQEHRDIGVAMWTRSDRATARSALLGSAWGFSWRQRRSTILVWSLGLAGVGLVIGYLTNALVAFTRSDPNYVKLLDRWGFESMITPKGFVGEVGSLMALALSFFVVVMLAMLASDDLQGRLDLPLANGTSRLEWMTTALVTTVFGTAIAAVVCGLGVWAGVEASGTSMNVWDPVSGMLNAVSIAPLLIGVTALLITLSPRFTFVAMASLLTIADLLSVFGPALHWSTRLIDVSPYYYLKLVPVEPSNWGATLTFVGIGVVTGAAGLFRFNRLDLGS